MSEKANNQELRTAKEEAKFYRSLLLRSLESPVEAAHEDHFTRCLMQFRAAVQPGKTADRRAETLCKSAARQAMLLERLRNREKEARDLLHRMVDAEEGERRRLRRDLHDEIGQSLMYLRLQLDILQAEVPPQAADLRKRTEQLKETLEQATAEARRAMAALSPVVLEERGLLPALRQLITRFRELHPCGLEVSLPEEISLPDRISICVYRISQELFSNIARHSGATRVSYGIRIASGHLLLRIRDNGKGISPKQSEALPAPGSGSGLRGIEERVRVFGGNVELSSGPRGTRFRIRIPLPQYAASGAHPEHRGDTQRTTRKIS